MNAAEPRRRASERSHESSGAGKPSVRGVLGRLRRGVWSGVLALGLVLILGGVVAVDRALVQSDREQAALDAVESAA